MLVNKAKKKANKWFPILGLVLAFGIAGSVSAATSTANILPGSSSAEGSTITAPGTSGKLTVSSSGPAYYVQGYAKKSISFWPDSTAASKIAYPNTTVSTSFSATKGDKYYAQAYTQANATSIYGEAKMTIN